MEFQKRPKSAQNYGKYHNSITAQIVYEMAKRSSGLKTECDDERNEAELMGTCLNA